MRYISYHNSSTCCHFLKSKPKFAISVFQRPVRVIAAVLASGNIVKFLMQSSESSEDNDIILHQKPV